MAMPVGGHSSWLCVAAPVPTTGDFTSLTVQFAHPPTRAAFATGAALTSGLMSAHPDCE